MNIIPCTEDCIYQFEGCCRMKKAGAPGDCKYAVHCIHYVPRHREPSEN